MRPSRGRASNRAGELSHSARINDTKLRGVGKQPSITEKQTKESRARRAVRDQSPRVAAAHHALARAHGQRHHSRITPSPSIYERTTPTRGHQDAALLAWRRRRSFGLPRPPSAHRSHQVARTRTECVSAASQRAQRQADALPAQRGRRGRGVLGRGLGAGEGRGSGWLRGVGRGFGRWGPWAGWDGWSGGGVRVARVSGE
jgi:hypothetical protein